MQTCPNCSKENPDGEAYCYSCGHILPAALADLADSTSLLEEMYEKLEPRRRWGTAYFDQKSRLELTLRDEDEMLTVEIQDTLVLGRQHKAPPSEQPDVDLRPYNAQEKGVSRRHLMLSRDQETIVVSDLGSANHTFLNGQRLMPYEPRILRDKDELRLGHMVIRVRFITQARG